ncbi:MAG TPA: hypothetical protein DCP69_04905 [Candidatus Omnitrophica bacterium]|nr:hypothetical protein [Candidatus Omnitrophota bacterium]
MSDLPRAVAKASSRLAALEQEMAAGTWRPTVETLTVIVRHTLGIVAALEATIPTVAAVRSSS